MASGIKPVSQTSFKAPKSCLRAALSKFWSIFNVKSSAPGALRRFTFVSASASSCSWSGSRRRAAIWLVLQAGWWLPGCLADVGPDAAAGCATGRAEKRSPSSSARDASLMPKQMATDSTGCLAAGPRSSDRRSLHARGPSLAWLMDWQNACQLCRLRRLAWRLQTASMRLFSMQCSGGRVLSARLSALRLAARRFRCLNSGTGWTSAMREWMVAA